MKRLLVLGGITVGLAVALMSGAAAASSDRGAPVSVFASHVDHWRHWGQPRSVHPGGPRQHFGHGNHAPHHGGWGHPGGSWRRHAHATPVWVPGFWSWNGFTWILVPGHWTWH